tara:strand:- start:60 stop:695 length:636 start_codon:yes stop_codon:yes gene_type:complete
MKYLLIILSFISFSFSFNNKINIRPYYGPIDHFVDSPKYYVYKNIKDSSDIIFRKMESIPLENNDTLFIRTTYNINKVEIVEWINIVNKRYVQSIDDDFKYLTPSKQPWFLSVGDIYIEKKIGKAIRNVPDSISYRRTFLGIFDNYYQKEIHKTALYYESTDVIYNDEFKNYYPWISYAIKGVGIVKWINLNNENGFVLEKIINEDEFYKF